MRNLSLTREGSFHEGFTLIEVLTVIVLISILTLLSFGVVGAMKARMDATVCVIQLRQMSVAAAEYTTDNNGAIAICQGADEGNPYIYFLSTYLGHPVFNCPSYTAKYNYPTALLDSWTHGYGANMVFEDASGIPGSQWEDNFTRPGKVSQITNPSTTPLYMDDDLATGGGCYGGYMLKGYSCWYYCFWPAHHGGFNIVFFDGHEEWVPFNKNGPTHGQSASDYPQFNWNPYP